MKRLVAIIVSLAGIGAGVLVGYQFGRSTGFPHENPSQIGVAEEPPGEWPKLMAGAGRIEPTVVPVGRCQGELGQCRTDLGIALGTVAAQRLLIEAAQRAGSDGGLPIDDRLSEPDAKWGKGEETRMAQLVAHGLSDAGIDGGVTAVDCSEYPCIVYGTIDNTKYAEFSAAMLSFDGFSGPSVGWRPLKEDVPVNFGVAVVVREDRSTILGSPYWQRVKARIQAMSDEAF